MRVIDYKDEYDNHRIVELTGTWLTVVCDFSYDELQSAGVILTREYRDALVEALNAVTFPVFVVDADVSNSDPAYRPWRDLWTARDVFVSDDRDEATKWAAEYITLTCGGYTSYEEEGMLVFEGETGNMTCKTRVRESVR